jgi:hypothetical protein
VGSSSRYNIRMVDCINSVHYQTGIEQMIGFVVGVIIVGIVMIIFELTE